MQDPARFLRIYSGDSGRDARPAIAAASNAGFPSSTTSPQHTMPATLRPLDMNDFAKCKASDTTPLATGSRLWS